MKKWPIALLALPENSANVSFLMKTMINTEIDVIKTNGLDLNNGHHATVDILRSQLDGKMAHILSGAGGASYQFCTANIQTDSRCRLSQQWFSDKQIYQQCQGSLLGSQ